MLPILEFIFSSFWVWAGTVVLVTIIGATLSDLRLVSWSYELRPKRRLLRRLVRDAVKDQVAEQSVKILEKVASIANLLEKAEPSITPVSASSNSITGGKR